MSDKHLSTGSTVPPFTGKLRIYNMRFCPYAQRPILILNAKKIPYEIVNVNLKDKPEWLTSKSPQGKVPSLEIEENVTIHESLIVSEYIDDKYPEPKLMSDDPYRKAQDKLLIEDFNQMISVYYKIIRASGDNTDTLASELLQTLQVLQDALIKRGTIFFHGNDYPGYIDYMIWPWFERIDLLPKLGNEKFIIDDTKYKRLLKWIEDMKQDPAVKSYILGNDAHERFVKSFFSGTPDYDFILQ